ncbi:MAG TPA: Gfo/Idh/MocA family oxidoreductase [Verrucomicrobiota bacterium]|nr:Gfo/Idh/MocA family oxidoreductase [Verrucomicrobiota bacterium]
MSSPIQSRRRFVEQMTLAGTFLTAAPFIRAADPAKKYRTALIGCGWWGKNLLKEAIASGRVKIVGLCDVDTNTRDVAAEQVADLNGDRPKTYNDFRDLLEREKPEIVLIATPDHWHALQTIAAVKAGAHIFVEKPTGHTVNESRAMLHAARDGGRVVQVGLHRRIGPHHVSGMKFLKSGAVGEIGMVRLFAVGGGGPEKPAANREVPEGMDWNLWCGPAPVRPFNPKLHPGGWRNFLDYANGQLGDWGVHWLDQVLWWSDEKYPKRVFCSGGRPIAGPAILNNSEQTSDTPDHQVATYEFEKFTCVWEHRRFAENGPDKHSIGAYFYGTKVVLQIGWRDGWTFYPVNDKAPVIHEDSQLQEPDGHNLTLLWADFLGAIEYGKPAVAGIENAHRSSVLPLLGMISWRTGRSLTWDGARERIIGDPEADALLSRPYRSPWVYPTS